MKTILFSTLLSVFLNFSNAQDGRPDRTFGNRGIVKTSLGRAYNYYNSGTQILPQPDGSMFMIYESPGLFFITKKMADGTTDMSYGFGGFSVPVAALYAHAAQQPDGKIVIVGSNYNLNSENFVIARFNVNGRLDKSFGKDGIQFSRDPGIAADIIIQSDGKIIIAGNYDDFRNQIYNVVIARYNTNGSPDNSFGAGGQIQTDYQYNDWVNTIAVQADGKIVIGGSSIMRFNSNGIQDNTFNGGERMFINVEAIMIQPDGKIVSANSFGGNNFSITRLNTDGLPDNTFDGDGYQTIDFGITGAAVKTIALQAADKIMVAGYAKDGINTNLVTGRLNANGSLDVTYSVDGKMVSSFGSATDFISAVFIQNDGKFFAIGSTINAAVRDVAVARYNSNGEPDNSFDGDGKLIDHLILGYSQFTCTAVQKDGKALAAGYTWNGRDFDFALVRYNLDGTLDNSFSFDGKLRTDFGATDDKVNAMVIQCNGKILLAGAAGNNFALARYNCDGSPDNSFDNDGKLMNHFGADDIARSIAVQKNGKIIAGGNYILARYNANGSPDLSFDGDGIVHTQYPINALAIQNSGNILTVGADLYKNTTVARYLPGGLLDNTFGSDGIKFLRSSDGDYYITGNSIAVRGDDKIIIGGYQEYNFRGYASTFMLQQLNADGSDDNDFNSGNPVFTSMGTSIDYGTSVILQKDNKIILAGYSNDGIKENFALLRYNTDGSLDNTFGRDGKQITPATAGNNGIKGVAIFGNKLYAAGYGQNPSYFAVIARYNLYPHCHTEALIAAKALPDQQNQALTFQLSPNPARDLLFIQSAFVNEKVTLQIIGADGKKWKEAVFEKAVNRLLVNVSSLATGTYVLRLFTKTKTETGRFIKE
jgi:uncharacterized delta-60 repeat protein